MVARYGGEEFAILLPDTDAPQAMAMAQKICAAVGNLGIAHAASATAAHVTISIGVACIHPLFIAPSAELIHTLEDPSMAQMLFEQADAALYAAKQQGRNRAVLQPTLTLNTDDAA